MNEGFNAATAQSDEWETPGWLYQALDTEFAFTLDAAATAENRKAAVFFTAETNGLAQSWRGHRVFVNPPYSAIGDWVTKADAEFRSHRTMTVMLLPSRTDTDWFHFLVERRVELRWLRKRVRFLLDKKPGDSPRFGSLLAIWR